MNLPNKTNSENIHLVLLILKKNKKTTESGFFLLYQEYKNKIPTFGICFILYFLKLSARRGFCASVLLITNRNVVRQILHLSTLVYVYLRAKQIRIVSDIELVNHI